MSALARKRFKTNTRIADERLTLCVSRFICSTNSAIALPSFLAISRKPCQNSSSNDTLVLFPFTDIDRLIMVVIIAVKCPQRGERCGQCVIFSQLPNYWFPSSFSFCCAARCVVPGGRHAARHAAPSPASAHQHLSRSASLPVLRRLRQPPGPEAKKPFDEKSIQI